MDLVQLQKKHPHEDLQWGLFVSKAMSLRISAFNDANDYIRNNIISGTTLYLPSEQLYRLILHIVLPKTEQDWISDFKNLVSFRKLPKNQHEFPPDPTKFTDWYNASLEFIHETLDVTDFLASLPKKNFTPVMRTFNQKPGLIQLMYDLIPQKLGKNINDMIPYEAIIQCKTISEYTRLFIIELNKLNDCTENSKLNRSRLSNGIISAPADRDSSRFGTGKYTHNNTNFINKHNNPSNSQIVPYKNPHEGRLHNMYDRYNTNNLEQYYDRNDVEDYNNYVTHRNNNNAYDTEYYDNAENTSDSDEYYDYDETFGNRPAAIEGINPGINVTNNLSYVDRDSDNKQKQPCFDEIYGKCTLGRSCKFSHDFKDLQREATRRQAELANSKYLPKPPQQSSTNTRPTIVPTSILKRDPALRSMGTAEEEFGSKVSNSNFNNTNNSLYNNNNRDNNELRGGEETSHGASLI
jgi:hypothetical protein